MLLCVLILLFLSFCNCIDNNVCGTMEDYYTMNNNSNCWNDPAANKLVPEIIKESGRPFREYKVTTSDGYILTIFRIPNDDSPRKQKYSVFLQHGLVATSANWVSLGNDSLAFQLYDHGYDVWMGNYRGTQYSQEHVRYTTNDNEYWDYSIDDVALKDIPAVLKFISQETNSKGNIIYIGHSLGCTFALMYASEFPEEAREYIRLVVLTAPAYTLNNIISPIRLLAPFADLIMSVSNRFGLSRLLSRERTTKGISKLICLESPALMQQCFESILYIYGPKTGVKVNKYPVFFDQHPSGTALKLIRHVVDLTRNSFMKYDYGANNMMVYGSYSPPAYDISKIIVPTVVVYAKNDWLTSKKDSLNLYKKLPISYRSGLYEVKDDNFNHIDFMFGSRAKDVYIDYIIKLLEQLPKS